MCGICGFTGEVNKVTLKKMTDTIYHRGPDEEGFYSDGLVNLGVRRLSIIDIKTGQQPIHNEDKNIWVVFNGEVYNFRDLRKDLESKGHRFYTDHSDTEVLVHLYEEYGIDFMHKINGMFAIAIWDKDEKTLFLVRDRMGVKPIFYAVINGNFVFGSEIKTILMYPEYSRDINHEAIYHYFTFKNIPSPLTAFKGIYSIGPGEWLKFAHGALLKHRWWKIKFNEENNYDEIYVKDRLLSLLEDATKIRMISDVPFGAYLSGGIDSSAVVALMQKFSNKPIKTFSLGYEDQLKNKEADLYYARKVSKAFNTEHHEYIMSSQELLVDIENVIRSFDQPFSGTISTYFITKLIKQHVKVAFSGDAADELFGSYLSHRMAYPMHNFTRLFDKIRSGFLTKHEKGYFRQCDISFLEKLHLESSGDEAKWRYQLSLFSDEEKKQLLAQKLLRSADGVTSLSLFKENFLNLTASDPLNRILEMEWNTQLPDQILAFIDFLSMAHSVEVRSPFLDYRLVEFTATIPGNLKIKNGNTKDILKKSVAGLLPKDITNRRKEGFVLPVFNWMEGQLKDYCNTVLSVDRLKQHGLLNIEIVSDILRSYFSGNRMFAGRVWNLMMFQVWWEIYFG